MSERMFFVAEIPANKLGWRLTLTSITESELIHRLNIICDEMHSPSKSIDTLLRGTKEDEGLLNLVGLQ